MNFLLTFSCCSDKAASSLKQYEPHQAKGRRRIQIQQVSMQFLLLSSKNSSSSVSSFKPSLYNELLDDTPLYNICATLIFSCAVYSVARYFLLDEGCVKARSLFRETKEGGFQVLPWVPVLRFRFQTGAGGSTDVDGGADGNLPCVLLFRALGGAAFAV